MYFILQFHSELQKPNQIKSELIVCTIIDIVNIFSKLIGWFPQDMYFMYIAPTYKI